MLVLLRALSRLLLNLLSWLRRGLMNRLRRGLMNRVRRGDDIDVGHALVTAAGHGLGIDLRFRAAIPWDEDAWIRARRRSGAAGVGATDLLGTELDEVLQRMDDGVDLPTRGGWREDLSALAQLAKEAAGQGSRTDGGGSPWR